MKKFKLIFLTFIFTLNFSIQSNSNTIPSSFADLAERLMPSVVNIYTQRIVSTPTYSQSINPIFQRFFKSKQAPTTNRIKSSLGSGVIVSSDGYILTNHHVINRADKVKVELADGRSRLATVVGFDEPTDLAVIKIDISDASPLLFGNPSNVKIGDIVLAIGNPYGIGQTVTQGIVSATGRHGLHINTYEKYILGSAEVVGLMCLKIFVSGDEDEYQRLKMNAMKLGSAFQKINFLRDLNDDFNELGRTYFPGINMNDFNNIVKKEIEADIEKDFRLGYEGILMLPKRARFGVYMAYKYYFKLFKKIKRTKAERILEERVRIPNRKKARILVTSYVRHNLNIL